MSPSWRLTRSARELSGALPRANIVLGDGTDHDLLENEGLTDADAFVTLSGLDEENIMSGLYAIRRGVPKVIVKNNRDNYAELLQDLGLDSVVNTKHVTSNTILRAVRTRGNASPLSGVQPVPHDGRQGRSAAAKKDAAYTGIRCALKVRKDALVAVIVRADAWGAWAMTREPDDASSSSSRNGVMALEDVVEGIGINRPLITHAALLLLLAALMAPSCWYRYIMPRATPCRLYMPCCWRWRPACPWRCFPSLPAWI